MSPEFTLLDLRHDGDLLSALRTDGPWAHPSDGPEGLLNAVLTHLVDRRREHPVQLTDGAFTTAEQLTRALALKRGCDAADTADALRRLREDRLVESCGAAVGSDRWRATEHAMHTVRTALIAA
ncbi:MAG: hypothetical protein JHD16_06230 [Solirubrobacteraceae bacterium]|nr:hypothetical protein [Solirubrobacteraceae bacterium]